MTLTLADEIDVARGDVLAAADDRPEVADQFAAHLVWMDDEPMLPGRSYLMRIGTPDAPAHGRRALKHQLDVNTLEQHRRRRRSTLNEIGVCNLAIDAPVAFDPYAENRDTGAFILIDRLTQRDGRRRHDRLRAAPRAPTSTGRRST